MKIVVDENIPRQTVVALREQGHDVIDVRESPQKGANDDVLWVLAQQTQAVLVTTDKGFLRRHSEPHHGVLIVRLRQPNRQRIHDRVMAAISRLTPENWRDQIVVMRDRVQSVRRRKPDETT